VEDNIAENGYAVENEEDLVLEEAAEESAAAALVGSVAAFEKMAAGVVDSALAGLRRGSLMGVRSVIQHTLVQSCMPP